MMFPIPRNEARRLAELREFSLSDPAPEPTFERLTRLAARHFAMPMAAITLVEEYRIWTKAAYGMAARDVAREDSICAHTIMLRGALVVPDVRADHRFGRLVPGIGAEEVCFYAGAPLRTADGCALGALCVMDNVPREFTAEDEEMLANLAASVMDALDRRQLVRRLAEETRRGRQAQTTLARQDRLLQRLSATQEELVRLRLAERARPDKPARAEVLVLRVAREEAEKANAAKNEFLLRMSHELRTPLNAILGFGQILQSPAVATEDRRMGAAHIVTAGQHLLSLINEVLDIARIESGRLELALEPVAVPALVGEVLDFIRPLAAQRNIALEVRGGADAGRVVCADRQRFKQVLLNVLSNAVKYNRDAGRVVIHWREEGGRALRLCVSDEGPGIAREQAAKLFVAFERLGAEGSDIPGTGLGLALSKRLVEAMGGRIGARVGLGRGSTFWVRLPLWQEIQRPAVPILPPIPAT